MKFDLHVHTNHSDGLFSPEKIVDLAIEQNLNGIAITDHDTISAIELAITHSKGYNDFIVIPGIEISCVYNNEEVHILGYFIDYSNEDIITITNELKLSRLNRGIKMVNKINELGLDLSIEEVMELSGDKYIGRPHIARAMIKRGYISNIPEAFEKYLDRGKPAYVERYKITINETISLIHKAKGFVVLAHPGLLKDKSIINYCIDLGIDGIECIHSKHDESTVRYLTHIANDNNLIITGGSDYHGELVNGEIILGKYYVDISNIPDMRRRI
jgi:predicted metal-dependent phosphoesterase TrpH